MCRLASNFPPKSSHFPHTTVYIYSSNPSLLLPQVHLIKAFEFVDDGRTFKCTAEPQEQNPKEKWWWFSVSGDTRTRYAPFRADPADTEKSVKARIIAHHTRMLEVRAAPPTPRWGGRPKPVSAPVPATAPVTAPEPA
jgi:hypothetical protein